MADIGAIILAAGLSRRMGATNKLLLDIDGVPLIRQVVQKYVSAVPGRVAVVTGHEKSCVEVALRGLPVTFLHNPSYAKGQQSSVLCGLAGVSRDSATLVGLGDQPRLSYGDLTWLIDQYRNGDQSRISIPVREHRRGNPIIIPAALRDAVSADAQSPGCRRFTRANPGLVRFLPAHSEGFFEDIDTPEDYARLAPRLRRTA